MQIGRVIDCRVTHKHRKFEGAKLPVQPLAR
jgi:hypothetical protein